MLDYLLYRVLTTVEQFALRFGLDVHVVGFIGDQDYLVLAKIFIGDGVFFLAGQVGVEFLNRGEADVDVTWIDRFKVLHRRNAHGAIGDVNVLIEQVFDAGGIEEVIFGLFYNVGGVEKEQKIAIPLLPEIQDQARHDERLAASGCHVEQKMQRIGFAWEVVLIAVEKARKGFCLIMPQLVFRVYV